MSSTPEVIHDAQLILAVHGEELAALASYEQACARTRRVLIESTASSTALAQLLEVSTTAMCERRKSEEERAERRARKNESAAARKAAASAALRCEKWRTVVGSTLTAALDASEKESNT